MTPEMTEHLKKENFEILFRNKAYDKIYNDYFEKYGKKLKEGQYIMVVFKSGNFVLVFYPADHKNALYDEYEVDFLEIRRNYYNETCLEYNYDYDFNNIDYDRVWHEYRML